MISHNMTPLSPIAPVDHFSLIKEWNSELRLFMNGAGVGVIFGVVLWVGTFLTAI